MRLLQRAIVGCLLMSALSGCTTNNLVVMAPPRAATMVTTISCWVPADKEQHYQAAHETTPLGVVSSAAAKAASLSGCAAVAFQLTHDGKARNITVLREFPIGYGYGTAVSEVIRQATFTPPTSEDTWYYRAITNLYVVKTTPLAPAPGSLPPQTIRPQQRT